jgi:hypothetical protein
MEGCAVDGFMPFMIHLYFLSVDIDVARPATAHPRATIGSRGRSFLFCNEHTTTTYFKSDKCQSQQHPHLRYRHFFVTIVTPVENATMISSVEVLCASSSARVLTSSSVRLCSLKVRHVVSDLPRVNLHERKRDDDDKAKGHLVFCRVSTVVLCPAIDRVLQNAVRSSISCSVTYSIDMGFFVFD